MERANGGGSGGHRIKVIKYKECCRNHSPPGAAISFDGCRSFVKSRLSRLAIEVCGTCGCHKSFHRRYESYRPNPAFESLNCLATVAAAASTSAADAGQPVPPPPTRTPRPAPPQRAPPQAAPSATPTPPPTRPPTILKSSTWEDMGEENKPLKKRKVRVFAET